MLNDSADFFSSLLSVSTMRTSCWISSVVADEQWKPLDVEHVVCKRTHLTSFNYAAYLHYVGIGLFVIWDLSAVIQLINSTIYIRFEAHHLAEYE